MKNNETLQKEIQDALKWEPLLNAAEIGVIVKDGIVTLTGTVDSYSKKSEAEEAAKNVAGVKAVVEKIEIKLSGSWAKKEDNEIATEIVSALSRNSSIPSDDIKVRVENGWATLEGELIWNYQKEAAKKTVQNLMGIIGISNDIIIKSGPNDSIEKRDIEHALARNWSIDEEDIAVKVLGNKVTLTGNVNSWYQKDEAGRIAWNAPGVWEVANELVVEL